jgi:hypothetical protein
MSSGHSVCYDLNSISPSWSVGQALCAEVRDQIQSLTGIARPAIHFSASSSVYLAGHPALE